VDADAERIDELERGFRRDGLPSFIVRRPGTGKRFFGIGVFSIFRWVITRLFIHFKASFTALVRAVPMLLFFSLITFFTIEIWQVFTSTNAPIFWLAIGLFAVLGLMFLIVRLPSLVDDLQGEFQIGAAPLRRRERRNLATLTLLSETLQVLLVSVAVWIFYVLLGLLLVTAHVQVGWLDQPATVIWEFTLLGERLQLTSELLRVATGVAAFAALYYSVTMLLDTAYREQFVDVLSEELSDTFRRRTEYLELLGQEGAAT
jgi:hypothetical protein